MLCAVPRSELQRYERICGSWPARRLVSVDDRKLQVAEGTIIITNRRLLFLDAETISSTHFSDLATVQCVGRNLLVHTLIVETSSGQRLRFLTKRAACRHLRVELECGDWRRTQSGSKEVRPTSAAQPEEIGAMRPSS